MIKELTFKNNYKNCWGIDVNNISVLHSIYLWDTQFRLHTKWI